MKEIALFPFDIKNSKPVLKMSKITARQFISPMFMRHLFLTCGNVSGKGGIKFVSMNEHNNSSMISIIVALCDKINAVFSQGEDNLYIKKEGIARFYEYIEGGVVNATDEMHCPECGETLSFAEKCKSCQSCGWSACSL